MEIEVEGYVQGHHMYSTIWTPVLGELLPCKTELDDAKDQYVVAVCKSRRYRHWSHSKENTISLCNIYYKGQHNPMHSYSAIYHHIFRHLDFLLWRCKIAGRMLLVFGCFLVTTIDFLVGLLN